MSFFSKLFGLDGGHDEASPAPASSSLPYVEAPSGESPIELRSMEVRAVISGLYAETHQTMTFTNPNGRPLEGSLVFPLSDGAVVSGYALDIDGQMVDGVVVPKKEARKILEAEIRKGVDPGLVEQVQGNVYRTRIYPIPAKGSRTVRITTVSELNVRGQRAGYHLPLAHAEHIDVALRIEVVQAPSEPVISGGLGNLTLNRWSDRRVAEVNIPAGLAAEDLQVRLEDLPEHFVSVEKSEGDAFFCASSSLPPLNGAERFAPSRLGVAWDASGSREGVEADLALLRALLDAWGRVTLDLVVFRDVPEAPRTFEVEGGRCDALFEHLSALAYDGGTDLTKLDLSEARAESPEAWLLFSDGLGTLRRGLPSLGALRVDAVTSRAQSDSVLLRQVASRTGGAFVNLVTSKARAAADAIVAHTPSLKLVDAQACDDVHVKISQGRMTVLGRLREPVGEVTLEDALGGRHTLKIEAGDHAPAGQTLARAWAGQEVAILGLDAQLNEARILELGRRFGLVTPGTSLLVLETLEQYLEYDLEPPKTARKLHAQWKARVTDTQTRERTRRDKQIERVLSMWEARVAWWETDFRENWARFNEPEEAPRPAPRARARRASDTGAFDAFERMPEGAPPPSAPPLAQASMPMPTAALSPEMMDLMALDEEVESRYREEAVGGGPALKKKSSGGATASMSIQGWSPDTPYLRAMKDAEARGHRRPYEVYLQERANYQRSPAFFLDCGDYFLKADRALGVRVLSNLLEMGLDDPALMRMVAWRLGQAGELHMAVEILERVLAMRDDEPQSHRDLALMLGERWEREHDAQDALRAMDLLYDVVLKEWERFPEIEVIALMELNRLLELARKAGVAPLERIDPRLIRFLDLDVRISMSWDADLTDVDLHVYEPTREHAYYGHNKTAIGGLVSRDFTQGYGPEEYVLRRAYPGTYTIKTHYYGSSQQDLCGPCTVIVKVFTNYGREDEVKQVLTLRLEQPRDTVTVGEITIGETSPQASAAVEDGETGGEAFDAALFKTLKVGMTIDEITAVVGQPDAISGGAPLVMSYHGEGFEVVLELDPALVRAEARLEGGVSVELVG